MGKDPRLLNIYLKIHNKRSLTMDDLQYLAIYSPECFEKTCKNVVYNFPNAKPIMEPAPETAPEPANVQPNEPINVQDYVMTEQQKIDQVLENLKRLEHNDMPQTNVNAREVKDLLGNLFMELLFPHNDQLGTLNMPDEETSSFDFKV
ncbi:MAG: hypothetical protein IJ324_02880 [Lachnospiraceae bacterium]|nr:hypothetical protein [Lachnospiraceae bacterium]